jgi:predicted glutamine amidotransferase
MCRLFGLAAGGEPVKAAFWLLEAPDSLAEQSRRNPDGYGLATFEVDGRTNVRLEKRPVAAYERPAALRRRQRIGPGPRALGCARREPGGRLRERADG